MSINAAQQESHLLYWDASLSSGAGFSIKATYEVNLTISTDSDMTNDVLTMQGISVSSVENAISISDSLPSEGASLARAQWVGEIGFKYRKRTSQCFSSTIFDFYYFRTTDSNTIFNS